MINNTNPQNSLGQGRRGRVSDVYMRRTQVSDEEPNDARPNFQDWYKTDLRYNSVFDHVVDIGVYRTCFVTAGGCGGTPVIGGVFTVPVSANRRSGTRIGRA